MEQKLLYYFESIIKGGIFEKGVRYVSIITYTFHSSCCSKIDLAIIGLAIIISIYSNALHMSIYYRQSKRIDLFAKRFQNDNQAIFSE